MLCMCVCVCVYVYLILTSFRWLFSFIFFRAFVWVQNLMMFFCWLVLLLLHTTLFGCCFGCLADFIWFHLKRNWNVMALNNNNNKNKQEMCFWFLVFTFHFARFTVPLKVHSVVGFIFFLFLFLFFFCWISTTSRLHFLTLEWFCVFFSLSFFLLFLFFFCLLWLKIKRNLLLKVMARVCSGKTKKKKKRNETFVNRVNNHCVIHFEIIWKR